eukprot:TRINITY_DN61348_c0_g1_i1.p1 TRINITY_DN61348_c0_g1~~TRINITY_DN61348_c0_g1_i1.p1  ORF type:complete len:283 (-),score=29.73 TRINITY_DN61348_c0_g1_i1:307-1155(-)
MMSGARPFLSVTAAFLGSSATLGYFISSHAMDPSRFGVTWSLWGPLCPRFMELLLVIDAVVSFVMIVRMFAFQPDKRKLQQRDRPKLEQYLLQSELFRFVRMTAAIFGPTQLGGVLVPTKGADMIAAAIAVLVGLYDLIVVHETLWGMRKALPEFFRFSPPLGKALLVMDVNRMLGFLLFFDTDGASRFRRRRQNGSWWVGWVCFVLLAYVLSSRLMINKGSYSYPLVMMAGCIGLTVHGVRSFVLPQLSGIASLLIGLLLGYHTLILEKKPLAKQEDMKDD